jgi:hypothetical protein
VHALYFLGACDCFIAAYDPEESLTFGFASLGDTATAEWGYIALAEIEAVRMHGLALVDTSVAEQRYILRPNCQTSLETHRTGCDRDPRLRPSTS